VNGTWLGVKGYFLILSGYDFIKKCLSSLDNSSIFDKKAATDKAGF